MFDKYQIPREKICQLEQLLKEQGIDGFLLISREASDPILPFLVGDDTVHLGAAFFMQNGHHIMITSQSDEKKFLQSEIFAEVLTYEKDLGEVFLPVFERLAPKKLALNVSENDVIADGLTYGLYCMLEGMVGKECLAEVEVSGENVVRELCSVKSDTEIEYLRRSIQINNDIYDEVFSKVRCGMSEREIGDLFVEGMKSRDVCNGLGRPYDYPIICIVREGLAHRSPGEGRTRPGDILIMDFSVKYRGYISDIARTAYFLMPGETQPPEDVQHAFNTARDAITATINFIGAGKLGWEVDAVGRKVVEDGGFPTVRHSVGHPIGRKCHDSGTSLAPKRANNMAACCRPIGCNEVYAIEPTVIQDGGLPCMLVEEDVVIRPEGAEILSRRQTQMYLISCEE